MTSEDMKWFHCNDCNGEKKHKILFKKVTRWSEPGYPVDGGNAYRLIECCGCETIKLVHEDWCSEHTDAELRPIIHKKYYPPSLFRPLPKWLNNLDPEWEITKLVIEVYSALQNDSPSLALMGIRAIIEQLMIEKTGDNNSFKKNMMEFEKQGYISSKQRKFLESALEAGHASIHRGFIPKSIHIETCMDVCENLIETIHILPRKSLTLDRDVPKRNIN